MSMLAAMTLPGLVVLLVVAAAVEAAVSRRRRRRGAATHQASSVAAIGFDALGLVLAPGTRHKREHDEFVELDREDPGDAAPPRSRVDLDAGVARIVVPRDVPAGGPIAGR